MPCPRSQVCSLVGSDDKAKANDCDRDDISLSDTEVSLLEGYDAGDQDSGKVTDSLKVRNSWS